MEDIFNNYEQVDSKDKILETVLQNGQFFNSAWSRYGKDTVVVCDICKNKNIDQCIGYQNYDVCLVCASSFQNKSKKLKPIYHSVQQVRQGIKDYVLTHSVCKSKDFIMLCGVQLWKEFIVDLQLNWSTEKDIALIYALKQFFKTAYDELVYNNVVPVDFSTRVSEHPHNAIVYKPSGNGRFELTHTHNNKVLGYINVAIGNGTFIFQPAPPQGILFTT